MTENHSGLFVSTIIATIARDSLERAVNSVLEQDFPPDHFEVIVVNDSGQPLPEASWQHSPQVTVLTTQRRERSVARNTGAAMARGQYLHFLDDDDFLLPGALRVFHTLAQSSSADWLYGSSQLYDRKGKPLIQLHHGLHGNGFVQMMAGEWVPLQASLILAKAFFAAGGFNPQISVSEDVDLCRRICLHGEIEGSEELVAGIGMGHAGSSTDYDRHPRLSRWAREKILNEAGVFRRMRQSANNSYLQGRIVRIYLTSLVWNLQNGKPFIAVSRGLYGLASAASALPVVVSPGFWRALRGRYLNPTFQKGFERSGGTALADASRQH